MGWFDWLVPLQVYKLLSCFFPYCVLFSTKPEWSAEHFFLAVDPSYCWLYPSKQAVDFFMLFACLYHALFSHWNASLSKFWQWIPLHVLLALADYWLRQVWIISKVSLTPGSQPGYKLNCTHRVGGWGERLNKFHGQYRYLPGTHHCLTTQLTDLVWCD